MNKLNLRTRFDCWIISFLDMIVGLLGFITLTIWRPGWSIDYRVYSMLKATRRRIVKREEAEEKNYGYSGIDKNDTTL